MKKSLIALALLGLSGTVAAQSSVTLYGRIDTSIANIKSAPGASSITSMEGGGGANLTGSRWGLRGTEDLGNGLSAYFQIEQRYGSDDGRLVGTQFNGIAIVGVRGGFGSIQLGRDYTAYDAFSGAMQAVNAFDAAHNPRGTVFGLGGDYAGRSNNQIQYAGTFGSVNVRVSHGLDETPNVNNDISALSGWYSAGPLVVGLAYQDERNVADYTLIGAMYDFGMARVGATFGQADPEGANNDQDEFTLGVSIPMGAFSLSAAYAKSEHDNGAERDGWGVVGRYALSNRTQFYAGYRATDGDTAANNDNGHETRVFSVGVRHDF